ncbi:hypothetical protein PVAP13_5NG410740 [Panicum virgatum]|uniref:Uncharacterized protein n=1 Tax=Panicum virgatum TaxID=38727 RepID=A0A8T0RYB3_PANVG|nr:hypothetical protein PVAP13_5NG410740 [Panicum virgatum]
MGEKGRTGETMFHWHLAGNSVWHILQPIMLVKSDVDIDFPGDNPFKPPKVNCGAVQEGSDVFI